MESSDGDLEGIAAFKEVVWQDRVLLAPLQKGEEDITKDKHDDRLKTVGVPRLL